MAVPPRNPKVDKLVTLPLMLHSYLFVGVIETGICYFAMQRVCAII